MVEVLTETFKVMLLPVSQEKMGVVKQVAILLVALLVISGATQEPITLVAQKLKKVLKDPQVVLFRLESALLPLPRVCLLKCT